MSDQKLTAREVSEVFDAEEAWYFYTPWRSEEKRQAQASWYHVSDIDTDTEIFTEHLGSFYVHATGGSTDYDSSGGMYVVLRSERTGQLFRKEGWYQSHSGSEWDGDVYEVQAREKTVTVYE